MILEDSRHPNRRHSPCASVLENPAHWNHLLIDGETKTSDRWYWVGWGCCRRSVEGGVRELSSWRSLWDQHRHGVLGRRWQPIDLGRTPSVGERGSRSERMQRGTGRSPTR